ncbi:MAG: hypothetical protein IJM57_02900 [Lachnospiraceae bacterium]|nr:hypothetical protein [Lachnospiraceae bacterium]
MYKFFMDLFENYPGFFTFFAVFWVIGMLAVLYLIALLFYKIIAGSRGNRKDSQRAIDKKQDEAIESLSKETKKALALEKELEEIRGRLREPNP